MSYADVIDDASNSEEREFNIINASMKDIKKQISMLKPNEYFRLRWLTPREWFRLMNVDEEYIDRLYEFSNSPEQLYKQAGNAIVVATIFYLYTSLFGDISLWWGHTKSLTTFRCKTK